MRLFKFSFASAVLCTLLLATTQGHTLDLNHLAIKAVSQALPKLEQVTYRAPKGAESNASASIQATGTIEAAFSPNEGAQSLVIKVINSAKAEIHVLAYSFTSAPVTSALLSAQKRGVRVILVADKKNNPSDDKSGKARAALSALSSAGAEVRVLDAYPIHHDKVIIIDQETVQLGSFNYSDAAARKNSENVLVNWNNPGLAAVYMKHFARNYRQSSPYQTQY